MVMAAINEHEENKRGTIDMMGHDEIDYALSTLISRFSSSSDASCDSTSASRSEGVRPIWDVSHPCASRYARKSASSRSIPSCAKGLMNKIVIIALKIAKPNKPHARGKKKTIYQFLSSFLSCLCRVLTTADPERTSITTARVRAVL
jgi:hypothetical protein